MEAIEAEADDREVGVRGPEEVGGSDEEEQYSGKAD